MRISHIAVYCKNLEGMKDFFVKYFDAQAGTMYKNPSTGLCTYFLSFTEGSTLLEIMTRPGVKESADTIYSTGFNHLAVATGRKETVDLLTRRLDEDGYKVLSGPRTTGDHYYESCVEGPEGIIIEVTE